MNERMNEQMTFLDDGGEGGSLLLKKDQFCKYCLL
jgi:hypothetical protein